MTTQPTNPNEFTCEVCGRTYEMGWSEAEADAEALKKYGPAAARMMGVACEDCTNEFDAWMRENVGVPQPGAITFQGRPLYLGDKLHGWSGSMTGKPILWEVVFVGRLNRCAGELGFAAVVEGCDPEEMPTEFYAADLPRFFKRAEN